MSLEWNFEKDDVKVLTPSCPSASFSVDDVRDGRKSLAVRAGDKRRFNLAPLALVESNSPFLLFLFRHNYFLLVHHRTHAVFFAPGRRRPKSDHLHIVRLWPT